MNNINMVIKSWYKDMNYKLEVLNSCDNYLCVDLELGEKTVFTKLELAENLKVIIENKRYFDYDKNVFQEELNIINNYLIGEKAI